MSELVREAIGYYHDLLNDRHSASTREALGRLNSPILRPHFVERRVYDEIMAATVLLNRGLVAAADRLAREPALRRKLGLPDYLEPLIAMDRDRGEPSMIGRFDALIDTEGTFKIIEYNASPGFDPALPATFQELPIAADFAKRFGFRSLNLRDHMLDDILRVPNEAGTGTRPAVLAIPVTSLPPPRDKYGEPVWAKSDDGRGAIVFEATLDEFSFEGGRLFVERESRVPVDILVMVWDDVIDWASKKKNPLVEALRAGAVRPLTGASRGILCGYKHTFELLTNPDYASMFEPEILAATARHVPWTRTLRNAKTMYKGEVIDLLPYAAETRERWILKPSGGSQGVGVVLGYQCTDDAWRQSLRRALPQKYILQERVMTGTESFPFTSKSGDGFVIEQTNPTFEPFVWRGTTPADGLSRLSSSGNHTRGYGGSETAIWIIEEKR